MQIEVGSVLEGRVTSIKSFGAFVSLPDGKNGMVHISEVSNGFIEDLSTVLTVGQEVKVKVINVAEDGKIALSIKKALPPEPRSAGRPATGPRKQSSGRGGRADPGRVWQPKSRPAQSEDMSFEDMMARFKTRSEEKISDLKRVTENRRGGGYSRRH